MGKNEPKTGPVFNNIGAVFSIDSLDFLPETSQPLKAMFDVDHKQTDPSASNSMISSFHCYYNLHVRYGFPKEQIHLAVVLHGGSTNDALSNNVYKEKFKTDNPNKDFIKSLSVMGVPICLCGQSMSYKGFKKRRSIT